MNNKSIAILRSWIGLNRRGSLRTAKGILLPVIINGAAIFLTTIIGYTFLSEKEEPRRKKVNQSKTNYSLSYQFSALRKEAILGEICVLYSLSALELAEGVS